MDYGNLLSRAWQIVWNNKFLFVLGFLAGLGSGGGGRGGGNANFNFGQGDFDLPPGAIQDLGRFASRFGPLIAGLVCLLFIISIVLWLVRLVAQGGLISAAARIDAGEKVTFSQAFSAGTGKLGRLVGINVIMYGPFTLLGLIAAVFVLATAGTAILNQLTGGRPGDIEAFAGAMSIVAICAVCLACLLLPALLLVTVIYPFAQRGAVLHDMGAIDSIKHGWRIAKGNLGDVILLIVLFVVIGIIFGVLLAIVLLPFAFLAIGPTIFGMIATEAVHARDVFTLAVGGICLGLLGAAINAIMLAFRSTTVTLAYQQFVERTA